MAKYIPTEKHTPLGSIVVWGGVRGDEYAPGIPVVESLREDPLMVGRVAVEAAIANLEAVRRGRRYIDVDLALCLRDHRAFDGTYEAWITPGILNRSEGRQLVVDMHERTHGEDDFAMVGRAMHPHTLGFVALAGIDTVVVGDNGLHGRFPEAVLMDISPESRRHDDVDFWRGVLTRAAKEGLPSPPVEDFTVFRQAILMPHERRLIGSIGQRHLAYGDLPEAAELLGVESPVYTLCDTDPDYDGPIEIVTPLDPDTVRLNKEGMLQFPPLRNL